MQLNGMNFWLDTVIAVDVCIEIDLIGGVAHCNYTARISSAKL